MDHQDVLPLWSSLAFLPSESFGSLPKMPSPVNSTPLFSVSYAELVRMTLRRQILLVLRNDLTKSKFYVSISCDLSTASSPDTSLLRLFLFNLQTFQPFNMQTLPNHILSRPPHPNSLRITSLQERPGGHLFCVRGLPQPNRAPFASLCARKRLPLQQRCNFAPLFSTTSRMPLPQPFCFQTFALLPGGG